MKNQGTKIHSAVEKPLREAWKETAEKAEKQKKEEEEREKQRRERKKKDTPPEKTTPPEKEVQKKEGWGGGRKEAEDTGVKVAKCVSNKNVIR